MTTRRTLRSDAKPFSEEGRCSWCGEAVTAPRRSWCSQACVDAYTVRAWPSRARSLVKARDRGVCAACGLDTEQLRRAVDAAMARAYGVRHPRSEWWPVPERGSEADLVRIAKQAGRDAAWLWLAAEARQMLSEHGFEPAQHLSRGMTAIHRTLWEADHIVPVVEGGGACGLENYRTLCRPCHVAVTGQLAKRRARGRRRQRAMFSEDS
jgi:hypothetical protein